MICHSKVLRFQSNQKVDKRTIYAKDMKKLKVTTTTYPVYFHKWDQKRIVCSQILPLPPGDREVFERPSTQIAHNKAVKKATTAVNRT